MATRKTVRRYIEKFGGEVVISPDHPLAIEQDRIEANGGREEAHGDDDAKSLDDMTKAELLAEAENRGVSVATSMRKAEIRDAIDAAESA